MMTCRCLPNSDKNDLSNPFQAQIGLWDESANGELLAEDLIHDIW